MIYLLFRGGNYDAMGGMEDCAGIYRTKSEAFTEDARLQHEWPSDWGSVTEIDTDSLEYREVAFRGGLSGNVKLKDDEGIEVGE